MSIMALQKKIKAKYLHLSKYDPAWLAMADGQLLESYLQRRGEIPDDAIIDLENDGY